MSDRPRQAILRRFAKQKGYRSVFEWSEDKGWLLWTSAAARETGLDIDRRFPLPPDFTFDAGLSYPTVAYLSRYRRADAVEKRLRKWKTEIKAFLDRYQRENDGRINETMLPALRARRDALQTQIHYNGERLRTGPLAKIRSLLMVWYAEAWDEEARDEEENTKTGWNLLDHHADGLWNNISHGASVRDLRENGWLEVLGRHDLPILSEAHRERILEKLSSRDHLIEETLPIADQLRKCEVGLQAALHNDPVPHWAEQLKFETAAGTAQEPIARILTDSAMLHEYARYLCERRDMTRKDAYTELKNKAEILDLTFPYTSYDSFRAAYRCFHNPK